MHADAAPPQAVDPANLDRPGTPALMTIAGLHVGRVVAHFINIRADLLTAVGLIVMALVGSGVIS